ncbi:hypothetical protein FB451DRAFT_204251 [Mycena latifolia]|nr:hypothetical protein FB451DRAFT_204251 [Mycena latifolia]
MSRPVSGARPVAPARATSIRKLTNILRATRRAHAQPSLSIPGPDVDGPTPPSSPSLYSLSSDGDSRPKLAAETDRADFRPLVSPTSSTFSGSASEGHGDGNGLAHRELAGTVKHIDYATPELDDDRAELPSAQKLPSPILPSRKSHRSSLEFASPTRIMNRGYRTPPPSQRIIIADKAGGFIDTDTSSLRAAGKWGERAKLQPLSPSEWIGSNVHAKKMFLGVSPLSPVETENRSPLDASSSSSSPATPRPRPISEINGSYSKPGGDRDTPLQSSRSHPITEVPDLELLTEYRRRPRSASEPRSFLGTPLEVARHAGTVPSTPTEYILRMPDAEPGPMSTSSQPMAPPPRNSSLASPMPKDVYFTAAGRRESRMYISPDAAPDRVPLSPMHRGHAYSSSEPVFPTEPDNGSSTPTRYGPWSGSKPREPSGRPFEDAVARGVSPSDGDSTPVLRKEELWSGEWNRDDIQDVIKELRSLK